MTSYMNLTNLTKILLILIMTTEILSCDNNIITAPKAAKIPKILTKFNTKRTDNYYWLNNIDNPKVIEYLEDENKYIDKKLSNTKDLQKTIFDEILSRIQPKDSSVPFYDNGYFYYSRYEPQKEHPVNCRKKGSLESKEEVIFDENEMAVGYPFFELESFDFNPANKLVAYGIDTIGKRQYEIRVKDTKSGKVLPDVVKNTDGTVVWTNDNKSFYYVKKDNETLREYKVCKHTLGTDTTKDVTVYQENDEAFYVSVYRSKSDKYIYIASESTSSTEYRILQTADLNGKFKVFQKREKNHEYQIVHNNDKFYILSNYKAENFRVFETSENKTDKKYWKEVILHDKNKLIEEVDIFKNFLVLKERENSLINIRIINLKTKNQKYLKFKDEVYEVWLSDNNDFNTDKLRIGYSSLTTPVSYYDYNMKTGKQVLLKQKSAGENFKSGNYESKRLYATAKDGVKIPISLVYRKGISLNGNNPLLIYGYGAYGYSSETYFSRSLISLLDRGFVYAIAHVRGGQELGRKWYEDGKLLKKKNTFTDFVACTKFLHNKGYSKPSKTFAEGGSAGGLLVGAVANSNPELYTGIVAEVPFVDVITTMLDNSIPLTTGEFDEWGNPSKKKYFDYMLSYSPYDQIKKQKYPAILATAGLYDSQVQYWEPAKWVAKLRDFNESDNPIFLYTNLDAGHGGASGRFEPYKETSLIYAFILSRL